MNIATRQVKRKVTSCDKYRSIDLNITKPEKDEWIPAKVAREAVKRYRLSYESEESIERFIEDEMAQSPAISDLTQKKQTEQIKAIVGRYIAFDGRRFNTAYSETFTFEGHKLTVSPDYWLKCREDRAEFGERADVIEVITVSAGRPEFFDINRKGSVYHNLETFGNLLYGRNLLNGRKGVVRVIYDYLKTAYDKNDDYSNPYKEALPGKFSKSGNNNRLVFEVPFDEKGNVISSHNPRLSSVFENYRATLEEFIEGIPADEMKKGTCEECEYFDRCRGFSQRPEPKTEDVIPDKKITREDFRISEEQQEVIDAREGVFCVDAGPGSGKTFSVSMRIADMIAEGEKPESFLCLSFSNAAVSVMQERVKWFVNDVFGLDTDVSKMSIATFHGLANEIVQKYHALLGFTEKPTLIDDVEAIDLVREAIDWSDPIEGFDYLNPLMRFGTGGVIPNLYRLFTEIKAFNLKREDFDEFIKKKGKDSGEKIWEAFIRYRRLMKEKNYIDYNDMEILVEKIIENNPELITKLYNYKHIIIDEFQDSNDFQMLLVRTLSLAPSHKSLMVIGDEAQAIYGFRGTSPENFINFGSRMDLRGVSYLNLTINRRSTPEIVHLSNQIISLAGDGHKVMRSGNSRGGLPVFMDFDKESKELPWVAEQIGSLVKRGVKPSDIAFIAHKKSTLTRLQGLLSEDGVLALYDQPEELLSNSRVRAVISLVRFLSDLTSTKGIFDYLCELYGNSFMFREDAQEILKQKTVSATEFLENSTEDEKKETFLSMIRKLRDESDNLYETFLERIERKTSYSYEELLGYIIKFERYESEASAEVKGEYEAVSLVTAHSSKGKEWKHVFVSLSDFDSAKLNFEEMPEKIRLAYVACTRAERSLTVTCCKYRKTEGDSKPVNRFWKLFSNIPGICHYLMAS